MLFKRLLLFASTITSCLSCFLFGANNDFSEVKAEDNNAVTTLYGSVDLELIQMLGGRERVAATFDGSPIKKEFISNSDYEYESHTLVGKTVSNLASFDNSFYEYYSSLFSEHNELYYSYYDHTIVATPDFINSFTYYEINTNIFIQEDSCPKLLISSPPLYGIKCLSIIMNASFEIPIIISNNVILAKIKVSNNTFELLYNKNIFIGAEQYHSGSNNVDSGIAIYDGGEYLCFEFKANAIKNLESIYCFSGINGDPSYDAYFNFLLLKEDIRYNRIFLLPFDFVDIDYFNGTFRISNFNEFDPGYSYDDEHPAYIITSFTLRDYNPQGGLNDINLHFFQNEVLYSQYINGYSVGALDSFYFKDLEKGYFIPNKSYPASNTGRFYIKNLTYVKNTFHLSYSELHSLTDFQDYNYRPITVELPSWAIKFSYYHSKAILQSSYDMINLNYRKERVYEVDTHCAEFLSLITFNPFLLLGDLAVDDFASWYMSEGYDVQRLFFNFKDNENHAINKVVKFGFSYQQGNKEPYITKVEGADMIHTNSGFFSDLDVKYIEVDPQLESASTLNLGVLASITHLDDGFVDITESPFKFQGKNYNYFYQNVYENDTKEDFICAVSPLTIWYEVEEGSTIRSTFTLSGDYVDIDDNGNLVVCNMANPGVPTGMTLEEFYRLPTAGNVDRYDGPNDSYDGISIFDKFKDVINQIKSKISDIFSKGKGYLMIIAAVAAAIVLIILVFYFFRLFSLGGRSKIVIQNVSSVPKKKKKRRKKGERNNVS